MTNKKCPRCGGQMYLCHGPATMLPIGKKLPPKDCWWCDPCVTGEYIK